MTQSTDLLGGTMDPTEAMLLDIYRSLRGVVSDEDTSPCVASNARVALSAVAIALTDLGVIYDPLADLNC